MDIGYAQFVRRLFKREARRDMLMHAAAGCAGEAGELLDAVKKHWAYNKPLDIENCIEELGDMEFYMAAMRQLLVVSREEVLTANMAKLNKRYPDGYTDAAAQARADKQIGD